MKLSDDARYNLFAAFMLGLLLSPFLRALLDRF